MGRVVLAMESDHAQASPYSADPAVQLTNNEAAESVSPALQQASVPSTQHAQAEHHLQCHVVEPLLNTSTLHAFHMMTHISSCQEQRF